MSRLNVVVLAGGLSSRFWPLREKNLYPFLGKTSLEIHFPNLKALNPQKVVVVVNKNSVSEFSKIAKKLEPSPIQVVPQGNINGMAGGLLSAFKFIDTNAQLLILNANDYFEESLYDQFKKRHSKLKDTNTSAIAAYKTPSYFPGGYLTLKENKIVGIVEKPGAGNEPSDFVNLVFHYHPMASVLLEAIKKAKSTKDDLYEVALDSLMKEGNNFEALEYSGAWRSIKYPWYVLEVMDFFLSKIKAQTISKNADISKWAHIRGNVIIEDGVKILEGAVVKGPAYIGKNVVVGNGALVRESMIGEGSVIGFGSEVARSYFRSNVWLHKNYVGDSVFENNISLGSNALTANLRLDENNIRVLIDGESVDTQRNKLGAIIGSHVRIGTSANIMPGVRIGKNSFVGPSVLLLKDIKDSQFVTLIPTLSTSKNGFRISIKKRSKDKKTLS